MMKPIIFSTPMVQAILEGRKTQTRRVIKPQPDASAEYKGIEVEDHTFETDNDMWHIRAPYQPGDILWVREPFCEIPYEHEHIPIEGGHVTLPKYAYKADSEVDYTGLWKSSRFMPKKAARIFLLVKSVSVERLQDITQEDAIAEGTLQWICEEHKSGSYFDNAMRGAACARPVRAFALLWDSLNAKRGFPWKNNDYVWKIVFERTERP